MYARAYDMRYVLADDIATKDLHKVYKYNPTLVVETSRDNHQVWFRCDMIETEREQHNAAKWHVANVGADPGATSSMQMSRLPGFFNRKKGRQKCTVRVFRRDLKSYVPGQYSNLPKEACEYDGGTMSKDIACAAKKRRLSQPTQSGSPMSFAERDFSSDDWRFCMNKLKKVLDESVKFSSKKICFVIHRRSKTAV